MNAVILSIGDELVLGQTIDSNSAWLAERLCSQGIFPQYHLTVADDQAAIARAITAAASAADLVIITGGLGPTLDDLTRQGLAEALGVELEFSESAWNEIVAYFAARGRTMAASNRVQALFPAGTQYLTNVCGTAPGIAAQLGRARIFIMPGVPSEMKIMFERQILPQLSAGAAASASRVILTARIHTFGLGESTVGEKLGPLMDRRRNPTIGTTVADGLVSIRLRSDFPEETAARRELASAMLAVETALHPYVFGRETDTLAQVVVNLLLERNLKLATAESCTAGLLGAMVTEVPGSSAVYQGGWITYANEMKSSLLGVPASMLQAHGAVSAPVAQAMAAGALERSQADLALAITGVAGPDGGSPEKPVGTVWLGLASRALPQPRAFLLRMMGDRPQIRDRACKTALQLLRFHLLNQPLEGISWVCPYIGQGG